MQREIRMTDKKFERAGWLAGDRNGDWVVLTLSEKRETHSIFPGVGAA
jgi:hypothetical protein